MAQAIQVSTDDSQKLYQGLVANPAVEIRKVAVLKVGEYEADLQKFDPVTVGTYFAEELAGARRLIKWGDELRPSANKSDRQDRRRLYARAFVRARAAQQILASQFGRG